MNKSNRHVGILPLVCAVCERVVGGINEPALAAMLGNDELYICHDCEELGGPYIETVLEKHEPDHYAHIVGRALLTVLLADGETDIAEQQRFWTVADETGAIVGVGGRRWQRP